jgi:hypothetical protein
MMKLMRKGNGKDGRVSRDFWAADSNDSNE